MRKFNPLSQDMNPQEIFEKFKEGKHVFIVYDLDRDVCVGRIKEIVNDSDGEHVNTHTLHLSYRLWYR